MTDKTDRERIARIVTALLAKANNDAATPEEAMAAAQKAKELLEKHQLTMTEAELMADGFEEFDIKAGSDNVRAQVLRYVANAVGSWSGVTSLRYTNRKGGTDKMRLFGMKSDVEMAKWLTISLTDFIMTGAKAHSRLQTERRAYAYGAVNRVITRLRAMKAANEASAKMTDGRSLVVVKGALVTGEADARYNPRVKKNKAVTVKDHSAFVAGQARGDAASFNRPVGHEAQKLIAG